MSIYDNTEWFYGNLRPMLPPSRLTEIWEQYEPILDGIVKSFAPVIGVMTGYYERDISVSIRYYNELERPQRFFIWFNLYWMQFLAEFLEASEREQENGFYALAHRCWRDFCDSYDPKLQEWRRYHEYRRLQFGSAEPSERVLRETSFGVLFIMLHEAVHLTSDFRKTVEQLVNSNTFSESLPEFAPDKDLTTEIACDFCALNLCLGADTLSVLVPDIGRRMEIALLSLILNSLFEYLRRVSPIRASDTPVEAAQDSKAIMDMLNDRVRPLCVMSKISQNSKMSEFDGIDIAERSTATGIPVMRFLQCVSKDILQESRTIEAYNRLEEAQKPPRQSLIAPYTRIWTRRTFE